MLRNERGIGVSPMWCPVAVSATVMRGHDARKTPHAQDARATLPIGHNSLELMRISRDEILFFLHPL